MLRRAKVVGKFVEFFGEGVEKLSVPDRATVANMAPEYGATMGFFPIDDATIDYFKGTGRTPGEIEAFKSYFKAQGLYGIPRKGQIDYSQVLELNLSAVAPSLAGPKRPQDRIEIGKVKNAFSTLFYKPAAENGYNKPAGELDRRYDSWFRGSGRMSGGGTSDSATLAKGAPADVVEMVNNRPTPDVVNDAHIGTPVRITLGHGDVLIAAITSCTNTSNPGVLLAAGLLAKKAVERGLSVKKHVKTSLAPGSRVVTEYLTRSGLLPYLEKLASTLRATAAPHV